MFFAIRRATLLIPSGPPDDPNRKHLFICLTDPVGELRETLLVSASTIRAGEPADLTCRLFPGDHSFIRQDSYEHYYFARIESEEKLQKGVKQGLFTPQGALDGAVFARVCKGLTESRFVAPHILEFYSKANQS